MQSFKYVRRVACGIHRGVATSQGEVAVAIPSRLSMVGKRQRCSHEPRGNLSVVMFSLLSGGRIQAWNFSPSCRSLYAMIYTVGGTTVVEVHYLLVFTQWGDGGLELACSRKWGLIYCWGLAQPCTAVHSNAQSVHSNAQSKHSLAQQPQ